MMWLIFREVEAVNFEDYKKWLMDQGTNREEYLSKLDCVYMYQFVI